MTSSGSAIGINEWKGDSDSDNTVYIVVPLAVLVLLVAGALCLCRRNEKRSLREEMKTVDEMNGGGRPSSSRRKKRRTRRDDTDEEEEEEDEGDEEDPVVRTAPQEKKEAAGFQEQPLAPTPAYEFNEVPPPAALEPEPEPEAAYNHAESYVDGAFGPQVEEDVEYRIDPADGRAYAYESFIEAYGEEDGLFRWEQGEHSKTFIPLSQHLELQQQEEEEL